MLEKALRIRTIVEADGRIEIHAPDLPPGKMVDVIILLEETTLRGRRSAIEILAAAAPSTAFATAEDVDRSLQSERDAWDK